jgi:hypothetical protein
MAWPARRWTLKSVLPAFVLVKPRAATYLGAAFEEADRRYRIVQHLPGPQA